MKQNYKMKLAYDGTRYYGWEHQPGKETVQGKIETVLGRMCGLDVTENDWFGDNPPLELIGAGRTDAGVHARGMVASVVLETESLHNMTPEEMRDYMNRYLPDDIAVQEIRPCAERFHARYLAVGKTYQYTLFDGPVKPVFNRKYYAYSDRELDVVAMQKAAKILQGEHDFKAFCGNSHFKKSTIRNIDRIEIRRSKGYIYLTFHGNGFLQNMVRIMVGTLLEVGCHRMEPEEMTDILSSRDRKCAGPTAPAKGLCLLKVDY